APAGLIEIVRLLAARVSDTLALRHARAGIEESGERFRDFFERTTELIGSVDAGGRLLHANEAFVSTLSVPREELMHQPLLRRIEANEREAFKQAFDDVIASGEPRTIETILVTSSGRMVNVEGS